MQVRENEDFTRDYYDPQKRYIGNALQVWFSDGTSTRRVQVDYPVGHRLRRAEGIPLLRKKFATSINPKVKQSQWEVLEQLYADGEQLKAMPVDDFMALLVA
jgi:2-methylcitrate dehydratase